MYSTAKDSPTISTLANVSIAAKALSVSKFYLYRLPLGTPGVYIFGRAKRFDIEELREWSRRYANVE